MTFKDFLIIFLLLVLTFLGGAWAPDLREMATAAVSDAKPLRIPPAVAITTAEPGEIQADTRGRRVMWLPLDKEIKLRPQNSKSVWVWGSKAGQYRLVAWTAVNGLPTPNEVCIVTVSDPQPDEPPPAPTPAPSPPKEKEPKEVTKKGVSQ